MSNVAFTTWPNYAGTTCRRSCGSRESSVSTSSIHVPSPLSIVVSSLNPRTFKLFFCVNIWNNVDFDRFPSSLIIFVSRKPFFSKKNDALFRRTVTLITDWFLRMECDHHGSLCEMFGKGNGKRCSKRHSLSLSDYNWAVEKERKSFEGETEWLEFV